MINLRFVPVYFDLSNAGAAGDADARAFVTAKRPELAGDVVPTPPLLLMNAAGEVIGEISNYAAPDTVLAALLKTLKEHPQYDQPGAAERNAQTPLARAEIRLGLQDYAGAEQLLEKERSDRAYYLLGRLARFRQDWEQMEAQFQKIKDAQLALDLRMGRAYRFWQTRQFDKLRDHLKDFPNPHPRYAEARYYEGLAHYLLGAREQALAIWKETIQVCSQNPWIYRADWAYTSALSQSSQTFSTAGARVSVLNRIGYLGRSNPDLNGPVVTGR